MIKKYFIIASIILCAAYIVHTRTDMTLAEEQPFLDERTDESSFLSKIKNIFTTSNNNQPTIEVAASAEAVAQGARPRKGAAVRGAGSKRANAEPLVLEEETAQETESTEPTEAEDTANAVESEEPEQTSEITETVEPEEQIIVESEQEPEQVAEETAAEALESPETSEDVENENA